MTFTDDACAWLAKQMTCAPTMAIVAMTMRPRAEEAARRQRGAAKETAADLRVNAFAVRYRLLYNHGGRRRTRGRGGKEKSSFPLAR